MVIVKFWESIDCTREAIGLPTPPFRSWLNSTLRTEISVEVTVDLCPETLQLLGIRGIAHRVQIGGPRSRPPIPGSYSTTWQKRTYQT